MGRVGWHWMFAAAPYGPKWRAQRKLFTRHFHPNARQNHEPSEVKYVHKALKGLVEHPEQFLDHMRLWVLVYFYVAFVFIIPPSLAGAVAISVAYGFRDLSLSNDPLIGLAEEGMESLNEGTNLYLVDLFPRLKHLPAWFPGAGFHRQAAVWREAMMRFLNIPFEQAEEALVSCIPLCR